MNSLHVNRRHCTRLDPSFPLNCPQCRQKLAYVRSEGDTDRTRRPASTAVRVWDVVVPLAGWCWVAASDNSAVRHLGVIVSNHIEFSEALAKATAQPDSAKDPAHLHSSPL